MHLLIIGAAGMIGRKLVARLAAEPDCFGFDVDRLTLADVVEPLAPEPLKDVTTTKTLSLADPGAAESLVSGQQDTGRPDVIVHLAAIVSGEAEADFEKGYMINLDGSRFLFEAIRKEGLRQPYCPRLVFASSLAVYGEPFPEKIGDEFHLTPLTSYGTQKAIAELLISDYTRKGIFDGIGLRLPTICVRPGKPNKAASGFFSNIIREPLAGQEAVLPVEDSVRHWFASPRAAVGFFVHAVRLDTEQVGLRRNLTMPGLSARIGDQIDALRRVAGDKAVNLIRREPDAGIASIVSGWPQDFVPQRALELGFEAETRFDEIIHIHIEDELEGKLI
ncbi:putative epimerase/dehydratase [Labrenzia sp. THAF82]|uniref:D-erythronate dehydrogenase n=1 Tax=Labrenzia sp. THAF82 TaxID=2587861 RepID=UPI001268F735|nr:D-erythronate dehydrogenase [Labrenzia sp. THAF82]QFT29296.1 putative epimerase/dehydratase [Labrenzia sp. THAF82]